VGAQHDLGMVFEQGRGVAQDHAEAARWFRLAAAQADTNSFFWLGRAHQSGRGVARDVVAAQLTPAQLTQADELARACRASGYKDCG